ncbi:MAG: hypothetical protein QN175_08075, partial [Armatimonadota bacterium]|nr:hypothetical protein [Armatimonadota bacterium]
DCRTVLVAPAAQAQQDPPQHPLIQLARLLQALVGRQRDVRPRPWSRTRLAHTQPRNLRSHA